MKKKIIFSFAVIILALSAIAGNGKIQFEKRHVEIDKVEQGDVAKAEFKFKNIGDDILVITKVKPG